MRKLTSTSIAISSSLRLRTSEITELIWFKSPTFQILLFGRTSLLPPASEETHTPDSYNPKVYEIIPPYNYS